MKDDLKIYFAGSIRGGRDDSARYRDIIRHLQEYGQVLTEHIEDAQLTREGESAMTDRDIFERDLAWLESADIIIAEVTSPSLGVGFEIATALQLHKKILCLFHPRPGKRLSAMIAGCNKLTVKSYQTTGEAEKHIDLFLGQLPEKGVNN